jgi:hypothetical protein
MVHILLAYGLVRMMYRGEDYAGSIRLERTGFGYADEFYNLHDELRDPRRGGEPGADQQ